MKKFIAVLLCALTLLFSVMPCAASIEQEREYFEDGSYLVISDEIENNDIINGEEGISPEGEEQFSFLKKLIEFIKKIIEFFKNRETTTKTKYISYYDSEGTCLWTAYITGEFSYNGKKSVCESVKSGCYIYDTDWSVVSKESSKKGNTATALFKIRQYKMAVPLKTIEKAVILVCDKDGNIK